MKLVGELSPILRTVATEVDLFKELEALQETFTQMKDLMASSNGVGLAAPQAGISKRFFVMNDLRDIIVCINPTITEVSEQITKVPEGCLSFPRLWLMVPRYEWVRVNYFDEHGHEYSRKMAGIMSQCYQHELEHLDGICFDQKVSDLHLKMRKNKRRNWRKRS
jgi:peptide deformylase